MFITAYVINNSKHFDLLVLLNVIYFHVSMISSRVSRDDFHDLQVQSIESRNIIHLLLDWSLEKYIGQKNHNCKLNIKSVL